MNGCLSLDDLKKICISILLHFQSALKLGQILRIKKDTKTKGSYKTLLKKGDLITLIKKGQQLYLVEKLGAEENSERTWVPGSYIKPLEVDDNEEIGNANDKNWFNVINKETRKKGISSKKTI